MFVSWVICAQVCQANCLQLLDAEEAACIAAGNPKMFMMAFQNSQHMQATPHAGGTWHGASM